MRKLIKSLLSVALAALMSVSMLSHAGEAVAEEGSSGVATILVFRILVQRCLPSRIFSKLWS